MALITKLIDDLDGSDAGVETIRFALAGKAYELDLSAENRQRLEAALAPFIAVARTPGSAYSKVVGGATRGATKASYDAAAFREWAKANGTSHRGRPSADEIQAFLDWQAQQG